MAATVRIAAVTASTLVSAKVRLGGFSASGPSPLSAKVRIAGMFAGATAPATARVRVAAVFAAYTLSGPSLSGMYVWRAGVWLPARVYVSAGGSWA